ncbi:hypothetical protein CZ771_06155 [Actinomycetales bacterium JB111]|nr:hypothetical protein CZ771_06155 [Actinomycetales bacterium JB111]
MPDRDAALAWRLTRQALDRAEDLDVVDVVRRVIAMRAWPADLAELTVAARRSRPEIGDLQAALDDGSVIRSYAHRGGSYVFTHDVAAVVLAVRRDSRIWEKARWQRQGDFSIDDWEPFRRAVRELLADGPRTREEIAAHLAASPSLRHLATGATGVGADSLYKPLHWWGDICFGPARDGQATFRLLRGDPRWPEPLDPDDAGRRAIVLYLAAYGPAPAENLAYWFVESLGLPRRRLDTWVQDLAGEVDRVTIGSRQCVALAADIDAIRAAEPTDAVHLLPGFDPWVMGPGTADPDVVPPDRRALASRGANLVIRGGVVVGTWRARETTVEVSWFAEAGPPSDGDLAAETERLGRLLGRELEPAVSVG